MPPILALANVDSATTASTTATNTFAEVLVTLAVSGGLGLALVRLRVPAGMLLGAMIASALLHATGSVHGRFLPASSPPGCHRQPFSRHALGHPGSYHPRCCGQRPPGPGPLGRDRRSGHDPSRPAFRSALARLCAGGVEAMAAMALALHLDPAFVGVHHVLRILGLNLISPIWLRIGRR